MKIFNFGFFFVISLIIGNLTLVQSKRGSHVAGRNNMPAYSDGQMSRIERVKVQERQRFNNIETSVMAGTTFRDYLFTVQGVEEFLINLPVSQQVAVSMFSYVILQGAYIKISNIDSQPPIKILVYENNNRLIHQSDFYFQAYVVFEGQQQSTYTIRFINSGSEKLITMSLKKLTQTTHIEKVVDKNMSEAHAVKASQLMRDLNFLFNAFERFTMINFKAVKTVLSRINLYYYWNIIETLMAIFVCIVQVTFIGKVCKIKSII